MAAAIPDRPPTYQRLAVDTVLEVRTRRRRKTARRTRPSPHADDFYDYTPDSASIHTNDLIDLDLKSIWSQKSYLSSDSDDDDDDDTSVASSSSSSVFPPPSPLSPRSPASFFPRPSSTLSYLPTDPESDTLRIDDLPLSLKSPTEFDDPAPAYDDTTSVVRPPPPSSSLDFDPDLLAVLDPVLRDDPWDAYADEFWSSLAPEPELPNPTPFRPRSPPSIPFPSSHTQSLSQPRHLWTSATRFQSRSTTDFAVTLNEWEGLAPTDPGPTTGDKPLPALPPPSPLYALSLASRSQSSFMNPFPSQSSFTNPFPSNSFDTHHFPPHPPPPSEYAHAHLATAAAIALVPRRPSEPAYLPLASKPVYDPAFPADASEGGVGDVTPAHRHARAKSAGQQGGGLRWLANRVRLGMGSGSRGKENVNMNVKSTGEDEGEVRWW